MASLRDKLKARMQEQLGQKVQLSPAERDSIRQIARSNAGQVQQHENGTEVPKEHQQIEQLLIDSYTALRAAGVDDSTARKVLVPEGADTSQIDLGRAYETLKPVFDESFEASEMLMQMGEQFKAEGVEVEGPEMDRLFMLLNRWGAENVANAEAARTWWQRGLRQVSNSTGQMVNEAAINLGLGLSLLDFASFVNKKIRLQFVPKSQRADIEQRVLPKIKLDGDREFSLGTTAALDIVKDRALGTLKMGAGQALRIPALTADGAFQMAQARGRVGPLVAALGENLSWQQVVESNWEAAGADMDDVYKTLDDMGGWGDVIMADLAFADAVAEMVADPFMILGSLPQKIPTALREAAARLAPTKTAQVLSDVARKTYRFEDAVEAWNAAKANLARVEDSLQAEIATAKSATGEGILSDVSARKLVAARKAVANEKKWLDQFADAGPHEIIMLRTAKRHPDELPDISKTRRYLDDISPEEGLTRKTNMDDIAQEMHDIRKRELQRNMDTPADWSKTDDLPLFQQRQLLGPDDAEAAGDALNILVRGGGPGVDDVTIMPMMPEYGGLPQSQLNLLNWRQIEKTNKAVRESLAKQAKAKTRDELFNSTATMLDNQIFVAKKALGKAREAGDKSAIQVHEAILNTLKKHQVDLGKMGKFTDEFSKYDDIWAPKHTPSLMKEPSRYHRWLSVAHDRVIRSLYPGGMLLNAERIMHTSGGQAFSLFREPQRFLQTYSPGSWDRFRASTLRYQQETRVWYDQVVDGAEKAGVIKMRSKWNPKKEFAPFKIDERRNELLFDLLDSPRDSAAWREAAAQADDKLIKFHDQLRNQLDHAADLQGLTDTPKYLTGYIRHVFDHSQFAAGARPLEYIGLPAKAEVFASHLLSRTGAAGYKKDAMLALDLYGRAYNRKRIMEPLYDDMIQTGKEMAQQHGNPSFQTYMNDLVSTLQGKPTPLGHRIDEMIGGAFNKDGSRRWVPQVWDRVLIGMSGLFWAGALPGNPRYPVMQIATGLATTGGRFSLFRTLRGLFEMATREGQALNKAIGTYDTFLDIFESDFMRRFSTFIAKRGYTVSPLGIQSTATTEEFIRGATALAAVDAHLTRLGFSSWDEMVAAGGEFKRRIAFEALRSAEEVNHMFGAAGRSPWLTRTLLQSKGAAVAGTQFLSFIPKQIEELTFQFTRNPGNIATYLAASGWISRLAAEEMGIDVTDYVGLGFIPDEPRDLSAPAVDAFIKGMDLMHALSTRDPQKVSQATEAYLGALDTLLPMFVAFSSATKAGERLEKRAQVTRTGERLRPLDFEQTLPGPGASPEETLGGLAESIRPGELVEGEPAPGLGGDFLPTVFGQQAIRDRVFREGQEAIKRTRSKFYFNMRAEVQRLIDGIEDNDQQKVDAAVEALTNVYKVRITGTKGIERAIEARQVSYMLRAIQHDPQLIDEYMRIIQEHGIGLEP